MPKFNPLFTPLPNHQLYSNNKTLDLSVPKVMGVINVTPDSFSDGGQFVLVQNAIAHAKKLIQQGADILDIGGESTRPNADKVATKVELCRVLPVIEAIRDRWGDAIWLSIDTSNPVVMAQAIKAGADMINDVRGLRAVGAKEQAAQLDCPVVIMHSRGEAGSMTRTMNALALYDDVMGEIKSELNTMIEQATAAGVRRENIIVDVGMGFAKSYEHHQVIMRRLGEVIETFGLPMLFGVSRKRYLGESLAKMGLDYLTDHAPSDRDVLGITAHLLAIQQGASIVRVHDVSGMVQAVRFWERLAYDDSL